MTIKITTSIHKMWDEWQKIQEHFQNSPDKKTHLKILKEITPHGWVGKFQHVYSSDKGEISLIKLLNYGFGNKQDIWEIHELSAKNLFQGVERFGSKRLAEVRIKELLE